MKKLQIVLFLLILNSCNEKSDHDDGSTAMIEYGYNKEPSAWVSFLSCWENETISLLASSNNITDMEREIVESERQGYDAATVEQIREVEKNLRIALPKSYKDFLLASNGWRIPGFDDVDSFLSDVDSVNYLSVIDHQYYNQLISLAISNNDRNMNGYDDAQDPAYFNTDHFKKSVLISDPRSIGIVLINPNRKTPEGEFEIWHYSPRAPGAHRFVSFAHFMQSTYLRTTEKYEYHGPPPIKMIEGTCAEVLGYPEIK